MDRVERLKTKKSTVTGKQTKSQSYQTMISSLFIFLLLSFAILKYRQYFLMLQTLKLSNKKRKKSLFYEEKKFGRIDSKA
jgi:hypothetical protein